MCVCTSGVAINDRSLYKRIFTDYNPNVRPVRFANQTIEVRLAVTINTLMTMNTQAQVLTVNGFIQSEWHDDYIEWSSVEWEMTQLIVPPSKVWRPDFTIQNSATEIYSDIGNKYCRVAISHTGTVAWVYGGIIEVACAVVLTYFPFDTQVCVIQIQNWAYDDQSVNLTLSPDAEAAKIKSPEWELFRRRTYSTYINFTASGESRRYSTLHFELHLRRKSLYYVNTLVLPCVAMTFLNLFVFWLPPDSGEKVSLGVTILLSYNVLQLVISDMTPVNSESMPLISIYLTSVMLLGSLSTVVTIFVLHLHHNRNCQKLCGNKTKLWCKFFAKCVFMSSVIPKSFENASYEQKEPPEVELIKKGIRPHRGSLRADIKLQADRHNQHSLQHSLQHPLYLDTCVQLRSDMAYMRRKFKAQVHQSMILNEWKVVALIIDRFSFWVCVCLISILSVTILINLTSQSDIKYD